MSVLSRDRPQRRGSLLHEDALKHSHILGSHQSPLPLSILGWLEVFDLDSGFVFLGLLG